MDSVHVFTSFVKHGHSSPTHVQPNPVQILQHGSKGSKSKWSIDEIEFHILTDDDVPNLCQDIKTLALCLSKV